MTDEHYVPDGVGMHAPDMKRFYRRAGKLIGIIALLALLALFPGQTAVGVVVIAFIILGVGGVLGHLTTPGGLQP